MFSEQSLILYISFRIHRQWLVKCLKSVISFQEYGAGRMLTGEVKKRLIEVLTQLVERHRRARSAVTDEVTD